MQIQMSEFAKVPYLDVADLRGRQVNLMPLWDGSGWHWWVPGPTGLVALQVTEAIQADYLAASAAKPSDLTIGFVHFMWQRASWPEVCPAIGAICDDFHNMATVAAKLHQFFWLGEQLDPRAVSSFVATELEYLLTLARGVFDLLQEIVALVWRSHAGQPGVAADKRKRRALPETFSKIVLREKRAPKTSAEIVAEYTLPTSLAEAYERATPFFSALRDVRDEVVHGTGPRTVVFNTDRGFCVSPTVKPFLAFADIWNEKHRHNENLVSLLPWVAHIVTRTIASCDDIVTAFSLEVEFPPPIAPEYSVFVRSYHNDALMAVRRAAAGEIAWWDEVPRVSDVTAREEVAHDEIEGAAYRRYLTRLNAGPLDDWLAAKKELRRQ